MKYSLFNIAVDTKVSCGYEYGVPSISRLLKMIGLFRRISSLLHGSFAKETYNLKEPTNRSHTTVMWMSGYVYGVATISRMLKNICLFAEYRSLL